MSRTFGYRQIVSYCLTAALFLMTSCAASRKIKGSEKITVDSTRTTEKAKVNISKVDTASSSVTADSSWKKQSTEILIEKKQGFTVIPLDSGERVEPLIWDTTPMKQKAVWVIKGSGGKSRLIIPVTNETQKETQTTEQGQKSTAATEQRSNKSDSTAEASKEKVEVHIEKESRWKQVWRDYKGLIIAGFIIMFIIWLIYRYRHQIFGWKKS